MRLPLLVADAKAKREADAKVELVRLAPARLAADAKAVAQPRREAEGFHRRRADLLTAAP